MKAWLSLAPVGVLLAGTPVLADAPQAVTARIAALDARCKAAGGRPVAQPYVFVHDYTGDGLPDFLISEGNYNCAGQPTLFRPNGQAVVEVYATQANGTAASVYRDVLTAYRLVERKPTLIQIAKSGSACAGRSPCGFDLQWRGGRLVQVPVGTPAQASAGAPSTPTPTTAGPTPSTLTALKPQTQAEATADCRARQQRAGIEARFIASTCAEDWRQLNAALPVARAIVTMMSQSPASLRTLAGAKAALPGVRWSAAGFRPAPPITVHQEGTLGKFSVIVEGRGAADTITFAWNASGEPIPYNLPAAMRFVGAGVTPIACGTGGGAFGDEVTRSLRIDLPGVPAFELNVESREAAFASQDSFFDASVKPGAPVPSYASLRASSHSSDPIADVQWSATCPP